MITPDSLMSSHDVLIALCLQNCPNAPTQLSFEGEGPHSMFSTRNLKFFDLTQGHQENLKCLNFFLMYLIRS